MLLAAGNINFGNLKIIPSLEGQAIFDDNIYMKNGTDTPTNRTKQKGVGHDQSCEARSPPAV